jgi:hypothetical protein
MNILDLYDDISRQQKAVKQLPARFQPADTSPQLSGPYPGRNATRGYLVGEDDASVAQQVTVSEDDDSRIPGLTYKEIWGVGEPVVQDLPFGQVTHRPTLRSPTDAKILFVKRLMQKYDLDQRKATDIMKAVEYDVAKGATWDWAVENQLSIFNVADPFADEREAEYNADQARVRQQSIKAMQMFYKQIKQRQGQERAQAIARLRQIWNQGTPEEQAEADRMFGDDPQWQQIRSKLVMKPRPTGLGEQDSAPARRQPKNGDIIQWQSMRDRSPQTGQVLDVKGLTVTVLPASEKDQSRAVKLDLANKSLSYKIAQTPPPPIGAPEAGMTEVYNPLDDERREQRAMDREREQFKRDELEFELSGEEERMRAYNTGTFYLRINGRIWRRNGEPVAFQGRERAQRAGQTIKDRDPKRDVVITRTPQDKLDEIDRRGFLKGLGSVAAGAALAKVPGQAQAKDPTGWTGDPNDVRGRARWIQAGRPGIDNNPAGRSYPEASFDRNNNTISYQGRNYRVQNVRSPDQISGAQTVAIPLAQLGQRSSSRRLYNLTPDGKAYSTSQTVRESHDPTYEDIVTNLKKKLGDYLQDVATAVKKDPDLIDKLPQRRQEVQAVKTIRTDDGHEIKIHGNEDDGFRISIKNQDLKSQFSNLDEAVMACELYCARRRSADYLDEKSLAESYTDDEYAQAMRDFLARGGKIEKGVYKEPRLGTRLRRQGSRHIGKGSEGRAGQLSGRGANVGLGGKPVVSVEEAKKDACYNKVKSRYKVWPSAYASGALVQCRKKGAKNWGEKSKTSEEVELDESLKNKLAAAGVAATMALSPAHARVTDGGQSFAQQTAQQSSQHQSVKIPKQIPSKSYLQNVASGKSRSLMDPDTAKELLKKYYNEK